MMEGLRVSLLRGVEGGIPVESYTVGLFQIDIMRENGQYIYNPKIVPKLEAALEQIKRAVEETRALKWVPENDVRQFDELIDSLKLQMAKYLQMFENYEELSEIAAFEYIGLGRLKPLLDDTLIDEIFQDRYGSPVYVYHRKYGVCDTYIFLDSREVEALRVFCELFGGPSVSISSPSLKSELRSPRGILRVNIDYPPISVHGPSIHIRKHGNNPFTISTLVKMNTIGVDEAAFLLTVLYFGRNVTIIGPSGSGKTTMLNALDLALPPVRRRVYVEDAVESLDLHHLGYHQLKLKVEPIEAETKIASKHLEVLKSLHRSPDLLILGEVQSAEHSSALFQAIASGIRGIQTFHSSDPEQAIRRWTQVHGINPEQILDLDVLVTMSRPWPGKPYRYVRRISEVREGGVFDIFERPFPHVSSIRKMDLETSTTFHKISKERDIKEVKTVFEAYRNAIVSTLNAESLEEFTAMFFSALRRNGVDVS